MRILGEFVDLLGQTRNCDGRFWLLTELPEKTGVKEWEHARNAPFIRQAILELAEVLRALISERLADISSEDLYLDTREQGHAFLQELHRLAVEHEIEVMLEEIDQPLTPSEMMAAAGYVRITEEGCVELTEQGIQAAEEVECQIRAARTGRDRVN